MFARIENNRVVEIVPELTRIVEEVIIHPPEVEGEEGTQETVEVEKHLYHESLVFVPATKSTEIGMVYEGETGKFSQFKESDETLEAVALARRTSELKESDWVVIRALESGEEVPHEWAEYRQALRDLPEQKGFPHKINWPESPQ